MMSLQVPLKAEMRITVKHPVMETQACTSFAWKSMILVRIAEYVAGPEASPYASPPLGLFLPAMLPHPWQPCATFASP